MRGWGEEVLLAGGERVDVGPRVQNAETGTDLGGGQKGPGPGRDPGYDVPLTGAAGQAVLR